MNPIRIIISKSVRLRQGTLLCVIIMALSLAGYAQVLRPLAHYTMDTRLMHPSVSYQKYILASPWDVSGNGRHATVNDEQMLAQGDFLGLPAFKKTSTQGWYQIPDPWKNDNPAASFSISFWYKHEGISGYAALMGLPYFDLLISNNGFTLLSEELLTDQETDYRIAQFELALQPYWYFITISYAGGSQINLHYYAVTTNEFTGQTYEMTTLTEYVNRTVSGIPVWQHGEIGRDLSNGQLAQVRFFKEGLTLEQANDYRVTDLYWVDGWENNYSYVEDGAFAYYPLNMGGGEVEEEMRGRGGNVVGSWVSTPDRFGNLHGALSLNASNAHVALPNFFDTYNAGNGFTISFWTKIDAPLSSPTTGIAMPFSDNDPRYKIFFGDNASGQTVLGMQQVNDRLGTLRYIKKDDNSNLPWYFWFYDPVSFNGKAIGWYHVTLVQHRDWMRAYIAGENEALSCVCDAADENCLKNCPAYYNYLGTQDYSTITTWGLGNRQGMPAKYLDDFRIYNWPLNEREVGALHDMERSQEQQRSSGSARKAVAPEVVVKSPETENRVAVFPNPTEGLLNVTLTSDEQDFAELELSDLNGKKITGAKHQVNRGNNNLTLPNLKSLGLSNGVYLLKVRTGKMLEMRKVVLY